MHRLWIGIRTSAVLSIIGSLLALAFGGLMLFTTVVKPLSAGAAPSPIPLPVIGAVMAALFGMLGGLGIWTAVDIFRRRGWARVSMLVFAALLTFIGASAAAAILVVPFPLQRGVDPRTMHAIRLGIAGVYAVLAVIGLWWLVLFNLPSTKEYFAKDASGVPATPPARPLSISVIAWWLLAGGLLSAVPGAIGMPAFAFGAVLTGWAALATYSALAVAQVLLGAGLLRRIESARRAAIAYFCLTAVSGALAFAPPGFTARMEAFQSAMPSVFPAGTPAQMPTLSAVLAVPGIALAALPIWFLVRRRAAFVKSVAAS